MWLYFGPASLIVRQINTNIVHSHKTKAQQVRHVYTKKVQYRTRDGVPISFCFGGRFGAAATRVTVLLLGCRVVGRRSKSLRFNYLCSGQIHQVLITLKCFITSVVFLFHVGNEQGIKFCLVLCVWQRIRGPSPYTLCHRNLRFYPPKDPVVSTHLFIIVKTIK